MMKTIINEYHFVKTLYDRNGHVTGKNKTESDSSVLHVQLWSRNRPGESRVASVWFSCLPITIKTGMVVT